MQAGKLDRRVTLEQPSSTAGPSGARQTTWTSIATVWASVSPSSGSEPWGGQAQPQPSVTHEVTVRVGGAISRSTVTPKHRFLYKGRVLEIVSVRDLDEQGVQLVVSCMEKV